MRAREIIIETVTEQQDIIKMSQRILEWQNNNIPDIDQIRQQLKLNGENSIPWTLRQNNRINEELLLSTIVGTDYAASVTLEWLQSKPLIIFASESNTTIGISKRQIETEGGWYDYLRNQVVVNIRANEKTIQSTLVHEIQHGLDYFKSHGLVSLKSKSSSRLTKDQEKFQNIEPSKNITGSSTSRAKQEVSDINTIMMAFGNSLSNNKDLRVYDIIRSDNLQSQLFKKLVSNSEFYNIVVRSKYSNTERKQSTSSIGKLFDWMENYFWQYGLSDFLKKLNYELQKYRRLEYDSKQGYNPNFIPNSQQSSSYLTRNLEINARFLQALHDAENMLKSAGFKGFSADNRIKQQQQLIVNDYLNHSLERHRVTKDLWPARNSTERMNRLNVRMNQYVASQFRNVSDQLPISYSNFVRNSEAAVEA